MMKRVIGHKGKAWPAAVWSIPCVALYSRVKAVSDCRCETELDNIPHSDLTGIRWQPRLYEHRYTSITFL